MNREPNTPQPEPDKQGKQGPDQPHEVVIDSADLFQGAREIRIQHGNSVYRLIITRKNKLILHT